MPYLGNRGEIREFFLRRSSYTAFPEKICTENLQLITKNSFHEITSRMDPLTHALASYTLQRSAFSRLPRSATIAMLIAGTIADIDSLSKFAGPSAFLTFHRTYAHSLLAALFFSLLLSLTSPASGPPGSHSFPAPTPSARPPRLRNRPRSPPGPSLPKRKPTRTTCKTRSAPPHRLAPIPPSLPTSPNLRLSSTPPVTP